jgi:hypothetical protein
MTFNLKVGFVVGTIFVLTPSFALALDCNEDLTRLSGLCVQQQGLGANCLQQATAQCQCNPTTGHCQGGSQQQASPSGAGSAAPAKPPVQQAKPINPSAPAAPAISETGLFNALQEACGRYSGAIVLKILPCGQVFGLESAQARQNVWPLVKSTCAQIRASCSGNLHETMTNLSLQLHCDSIGVRGDTCQ